jgi:hypothetical protein
MKLLRKLCYLTFTFGLIFANVISFAYADGPANFANCRLGAGGVKEDVVGYDLGQINLGLYLDWRTRSSPPPGLPQDIEYLQVVRVKQVKACNSYYCDAPYVDPPAYTTKPDFGTLANRATSLPGALWFIGNEIERRDWDNGGTWDGQDEITPELYATAFHEIRNVIKTADPTARIAIGSVVQTTPLRLEYLDRVWDSYFDQYGYSMGNDIDVWNVHGFIFREVRDDWGAEIPAGLDYAGGFLSDVPDTFSGRQILIAAHHDITYFQQFTEAMRAWMAAHGERNKPLIDTEYGILFGDLTDTEISNYLTDTFDYMLTKTDAEIGYPADGNKLIQGWLWFSLNFDDYGWSRQGSLFDSSSKNLRSIGQTWKNYVNDPGNPLASQPQQNLLVTNLRTYPSLVFIPPGETANVILKVDIANSGNTSTTTGNNIVVKFWDGVPNAPGSNLIGNPQILNDMPGCGMFVTTVELQWTDIDSGDHTWYAEVVPIADETNENDNIASDVFPVLEGEPIQVFLPVVLK